MIVCFCNGLREATIREVSRVTGARRAKDVYTHLGCEVQCGQCMCFAQDTVEDEHSRANLAIAAE